MVSKNPSSEPLASGEPSGHNQLVQAMDCAERDGNLEPLRGLIDDTRSLVFQDFGGQLLPVSGVKFNGTPQTITVDLLGTKKPVTLPIRDISSAFIFNDAPNN